MYSHGQQSTDNKQQSTSDKEETTSRKMAKRSSSAKASEDKEEPVEGEIVD